VSTSQAVVGAVLGIGVVKGVRTVNRKVLLGVLGAWLGTPALSFAVTLGLCWLSAELRWIG
jgi:PiT family inorganic phosphate transporter